LRDKRETKRLGRIWKKIMERTRKREKDTEERYKAVRRKISRKKKKMKRGHKANNNPYIKIYTLNALCPPR
jgi:hypothetical protein